MSDYITGGELLNDARETRDKLALLPLTPQGERLLSKIDALLALHGLHGGQQISLRNFLSQAEALLK